jgi:hypothetical protein
MIGSMIDRWAFDIVDHMAIGAAHIGRDTPGIASRPLSMSLGNAKNGDWHTAIPASPAMS